MPVALVARLYLHEEFRRIPVELSPDSGTSFVRIVMNLICNLSCNLKRRKQGAIEISVSSQKIFDAPRIKVRRHYGNYSWLESMINETMGAIRVCQH